MTLPYYPTVPQPSVGWYRNARQGDVTPVTPIATLVAKERSPRRTSHISASAPRNHPPSTPNCGLTKGWQSNHSFFFTNTTGGLIVMASKLYREGNKEPLIRRIAFNALLENA